MDSVMYKKINSEAFNKYYADLFKELEGKKVLVYGAGLAFEELEKKFNFKDLNIVAISDIKFTEETTFHGFKAIPPSTIKEQDFDVILMTLFYPDKALKWLKNNEQINDETEIKYTFEEIIPQEHEFIEYLEKIKTQKHFDKLSKKLKNKKVVIYGTGVFFQTINAYYNLSNLNIIALSDRIFNDHKQDETFLNYSVCAPDEIKSLKPDYVLVATRFFINIIEDLEENTLCGSKIAIRPLIKKPFLELFKEIWY